MSRAWSANRDVAPPPLLPERSDAPLDSSSFVSRSVHVPSPPDRHGGLRLIRVPSLGSSRRLFAFDAPSSPSLSFAGRTPSLLSYSSSSSSRTSLGGGSSHHPSTPHALADFGMAPSQDPSSTRTDGHQHALSLPFQSRPFSKWDSSLVGDDPSPHIVRSSLGLASASDGPSPPRHPRSSTRSGKAGGLQQASGQASTGTTIRSRVTSSAVALSKGGAANDFFHSRSGGRRRDASYLLRGAPEAAASLARTPLQNGPASGRTSVDIPYAVRDTEDVRDLEVLLLESLRWGVLNDSYTFVTLAPGQAEPERILDIGCGSGYWCISQASRWKASHFVGFDIRADQTNLYERAQFQRRRQEAKRRAGKEMPPPAVDWTDMDRRVEWVQGDFLEILPFDSGSFDMVRISFVNLGVPELSWQNVLEECTRVLKKGSGILEIVEMSNDLPPNLPLTPPQSPPLQPTHTPTPRSHPSPASAPAPPSAIPQHSRALSIISPQVSSRKAHYEDVLTQHMIQPLPDVVIRSSLLMQSGMSKSKEVFSKTYRRSQLGPLDGGAPAEIDVAPGFIGAATGVWVESMSPFDNSTPVLPMLHESIAKRLLVDLAKGGIEWAQPGRLPADFGAARKSRCRSLMPRSPSKDRRQAPDLGTVSLHAWVGVKSGGLPAWPTPSPQLRS